VPNTLSALPSSFYKLSHNPTESIIGDPNGDLQNNPYDSLTDAILFGAVNDLLGLIDDATGLDLLDLATELESVLGGPLHLLTGFLFPTTSTAGGGVFGPLLGLIPGLGGGTGTLGGLGTFLNPTTLTSGAGGILAPLFSGSTLFGSIIPTLDASKIGSGTLAASIVQPLIDAVSTGFGGGTGLGFAGLGTFLGGLSFGGISFDDVLGLIPGLGSGVSGTGSTGLASVFTDWLAVLGSPTHLGSGSPVVSGISSIPLLGGLFSGSTLLGSLIPTLDGSKIGSGTVSLAYLPTSLLTTASSLAASAISGILALGNIPSLPGSQIGSGTVASTYLPSTAWFSSIASSLLSGTIAAGIIPTLDGSKIGSGTVASTYLPSTAWFSSIASSLLSGTIAAGIIPTLDGSKIGSGTVASTYLPSTAWFSSIASSLLSGTIAAGIIPSLDASKLTTGVLGTGRIPDITLGMSSGAQGIVDGIYQAVNGGTTTGNTAASVKSNLLAFPGANLVGSVASSLLSGVLGAGLIPTLDGSKIGSGTVASTYLPSTAWFSSIASSLLSGTIAAGIIPSLDASKLTTGVLGTGRIPDITLGMSSGAQSVVDSIYQAINGGTSTGNTAASVKTGLLAFPGANLTGSVASSLLSGVLGAGLIPSLDASKLTTGVLGTGRIPDVTLGMSSGAQGIVDGIYQAVNGGTSTGNTAASVKSNLLAFPGANLTGSVASSLLSGVLGAGLIPTLDGSKIGSGVVGSGFLPTTPWFSSIASSLLSGTIAAGIIPTIDGSKIGSGTVSSAYLPSTSWFSSIPASSLTGTITETVTGLGTLRDSILNGLFNASSSGYTNAQAQQQAATVAQTASAALTSAAQANQAVAAIQGQANSNNTTGGIYKNISPSGTDGTALSGTDFASTGPTSGDLLICGNNSFIGIKSGNASNTVGYFAILNYAFTTDNQSIAVALGDQGAYDAAYTTLYLHADTAGTVGAYCRISNDKIDIGSFTRTGSTYVYTSFGNTTSVSPSQGNRVEFRNNGTTWQVQLGNSVVLQVTNASVTFSAARRTAMISMDRQHSSGFFGWGSGDYDSFRIAGIILSDYVIPTYVGSGARMYRTNTAVVTLSAAVSTDTLLSTGSFFGVTGESTADITVDLTNGKFTVANAGWYMISAHVGITLSTVQSSETIVAPILFKNGATFQHGNSTNSGNASGGTGAPGGDLTGAWNIYLAAGDNVQLGYVYLASKSSNAQTALGEASGKRTWFQIALINRSLN
jgi:hypothetical protein